MCTVLDELISFVHLFRQVSCPYVLYLWYPYELYIRSCLQNTKLSLKGAQNKVQGLSHDSPKHSWHLTMGWRSEAACKLWPCEQMWSTDHGPVTRTGTIEVNLTLAFAFRLKYLGCCSHSATKLSQIRWRGRVIKQCCPVLSACRPYVLRFSWFLSVHRGREGAGPTNENVKAVSDIIYILLHREQWM